MRGGKQQQQRTEFVQIAYREKLAPLQSSSLEAEGLRITSAANKKKKKQQKPGTKIGHLTIC